MTNFQVIFQTNLWRYAFVGFSSNGILYIAYLGLTLLGIGHITALSLLYVCGVLVTFIANRNWTFGHDGRISKSLIRYISVYVFGYVFTVYIEMFYNPKRKHVRNGILSPVQFERQQKTNYEGV